MNIKNYPLKTGQWVATQLLRDMSCGMEQLAEQRPHRTMDNLARRHQPLTHWNSTSYALLKGPPPRLQLESVATNVTLAPV
jgi:hypothetical protein